MYEDFSVQGRTVHRFAAAAGGRRLKSVKKLFTAAVTCFFGFFGMQSI